MRPKKGTIELALTRKMLKAMGIEEEKIEQIIEAHTETVEGLKEKAEENAEAAKKLPGVLKELEDAKKNLEEGNKDSYKVKYEAIKEEFEGFKKELKSKEVHGAKEKAIRKLLKDIGISEKRIDAVVKVIDVDGVELDENETIKNEKELSEELKKEWEDFIVTTEQKGANPANPPANNGATTSLTKQEIMAIKNPVERQQKIAENITLFQKG